MSRYINLTYKKNKEKGMLYKFFIFAGLEIGFTLLFVWIRKESIISNVIQKTYDSVDASARKRTQENRENLIRLQKQGGYLHRIEKRLIYTGIVRRFPNLTPEVWIILNLLVSAFVYFIVTILTGSLPIGLAGIIVIQAFRSLLENMLMSRSYRAVNDNLLKFLDFLGNYSITAGEVTGIFSQISKYVDEPLQSVLDECFYEAQTSGDASLALLSMAEKIQHPKFKELIRNVEISVRYSADFTVLVSNSRRAVREHLRTRQERKSLINEAMVNMLILAAMSVVILISVEQLITASIWVILLHTLPGQIGLSVIGVIFALLYRQIRRLDQ